jgi:tetratricopeptide (TPR) repeat protein
VLVESGTFGRDIHSKKGQMLQARNYYYDAQKRLEEQLPDPIYSIVTVETLARRARLAVFTGRLDEATSCLTSAQAILAENTFAPQMEPAVLLAEGQLLLTQGSFSQAETWFSRAYSHAEALQEPMIAADAQLGLKPNVCLVKNLMLHRRVFARLDDSFISRV